MVTPWYASREDVKSSLDFKETARNNALVDRALAAATPAVEGFLKRKFYPLVATKYFDWPNNQSARPWRLWLNQHELVSVSQLSSGGVVVAASDFFLEPVNSGPPYNRIEIDLASSASFVSAATHQRSIAVAGVWDYPENATPAGNLAEALDASETGVDVTDSASIGVGNLIRVDDERMIVTEKTMLTTGQTLQTNLTASANAVTVAVGSGAAFVVGEIILLDSERMLIVDVAGNNLTVKRAWDGSVLATHAGSTVYAPRRLTVVRGALGTTAATHTDATAIVKHMVPGLVRELGAAEAIVWLQQHAAGWARTVGSGDNEREASGRGINQIKAEAKAAHGRKNRHRGI